MTGFAELLSLVKTLPEYVQYTPVIARVIASLQEKLFSVYIQQFCETVLAELAQATTVSARLKPYFSDVKLDVLPFVEFDSEPAQVSQLKKWINALHLIGKQLQTLEQLDSTALDLGLIFADFRKACECLTQFDVDFSETFADEFGQANALISLLRNFAESKTTALIQDASVSSAQQTAYHTGYAVGTAVDQLNPKTGTADVKFLTQFSAELSGHLAKIAAKVQSYAEPTNKTKEPTITEEKLQALSQCADEFYWTLTKQQKGSVFASLNLGAYVSMGTQIKTLTNSILEQFRHINQATGEAVIFQLEQLKHKYLLELFILIDKTELFAALKPGFLATPIMDYLKGWYQLFAEYAYSVVDLEKLRPDLLIIEDSHFLQARTTNLLTRVSASEAKMLHMKAIHDAITDFYAMLEPLDANLTLTALPDTIGQEVLLEIYRLIRPLLRANETYELQLFDLKVLRDLKAPGYENIGEIRPLTIKECRGFRKIMEQRVEKAKDSEIFQQLLAQDLIKGFSSSPALKVLPYSSKTKNPFLIDESLMSGVPQVSDQHVVTEVGHVLFQDPPAAQDSATLNLFKAYQIHLHQVDLAKAACQEIHAHLAKEDWTAYKAMLRNLYVRIQPYLIHCPGGLNSPESISEAERITLDAALIQCLDDHYPPSTENENTLYKIKHLINDTDAALNIHQEWVQVRAATYGQSAQRHLRQMALAKPILLDNAQLKRIYHVFPTTQYSDTIKRLRTAATDLFIPQTSAFFSTPIHDLIKHCAPEGLPFPDIETDALTLLQTSDQVSLIKQFFNGMYYLETFFQEMESLSSEQSSFTYGWHVVWAYYSGYNAFGLLNNLRYDPQLIMLVREILQQIDTIQQQWFTVQPLYTASSKDIAKPQGSTTYNGIWYPMLSFMVLPEHLNALRKAGGFTVIDAAEHQALAKKTTLEIENIIAHSDTYFRLFLVSPEMVSVFQRLKTKMSQFSGTTYAAVREHLQTIRETLIPSILIETDEWELRLGLKPGKISLPMKGVLEQFFIGFIEPLGLPSQEHLALANNVVSYTHRKKALWRQKHHAEIEQTRLEPYVDRLARFVSSMENFTATEDSKVELLKRLEAVVPILIEHNNSYQPDLRKTDHDNAIDEACKASPKAKHLKHIKFLAKRCLAKYRGASETQVLKREMIAQHVQSLDEDKKNQLTQNQTYKMNYVTQLLNHQIQTILDKQTDVLFLVQDYKAALEKNLTQHHADLIQDLMNQSPSTNLQHCAKELLEGPLQQFADNEYAAFIALEAIAAELAKFKLYCNAESKKLAQNKSSLFESEATLIGKEKRILKLDALVKDSTKSAKERLNLASQYALQPDFQEGLMAYHHYHRFSWQGLRQLVLQLLTAIWLYQPEYQKRYHQLFKTAQPPIEAQIALSLKTYKSYCVAELQKVKLHKVSFESEKTLLNKLTCIESMEMLLNKTAIPLKTRLKALRQQAESNKVRQCLLAYDHYDKLSEKGLGRMVLQLFHVLQLETPAHEKHYQHLLKTATKKTTDCDQFVKRFGLFSPLNQQAKPAKIATGNLPLLKVPVAGVSLG